MEFVEEGEEECAVKPEITEITTSALLCEVNFDDPKSVVYCGVCSLPLEYCEVGASFDQCKAWRESALDEDALAALTLDDEDEGGDEEGDEEGNEDGDKKKKKKDKKGKKVVAPKKAKVQNIEDARVIIARIQRQKRKYVTAVAGLESVPDLKIKEVAKAFGKKFASGSAVSDTAGGGKEVVIQGDVIHEVPAVLVNVFKVPKKVIYFLEDKKLVPLE